MTLLSSLAPDQLRRRLASDSGVALRTGPVAFRVRTPLVAVGSALSRLYASYPLLGDDAFVDFEVAVRRPAGLRRLWQPQVVFELDGESPFNPLPGDQGFPLLEWGLNWCVYGLCHQYLVLHAAVLERNGRALVLPAPSGSGKSTLCAGLLFSGWRLLSDELALICPRTGAIVPIPRPVSLKNQSIEVIQAFAPQVQFGSRVEETSKGVVAHFAAPAQAVTRWDETARPGWVVMPRYVQDAPARLQPLDKASCFMRLVENAFNYDVYGPEGFELLGRMVTESRCFSFEYSRLQEAVALFERLADESPADDPSLGLDA